MVDFTTPNLTGASEKFNSAASQIATIKDKIKNQLEAEIDTFKSDLKSALSVLESDIKELIPELPEAPDVNFISELTNAIQLPAGSQESLSALTSLASKFGAGISSAGQDIDSLVSLARSAFSGDVNSLSGIIPNFVIGADGLVSLKPDNSGMPDKNPEAETISTLTTPTPEIENVNDAIKVAVEKATLDFSSAVAQVEMVIASDNGTISNLTKRAFDKADAIAEAAAIKAKVPSHPQTTKVLDAFLTFTTLPPKTKIIKITDADKIEIENLKSLQYDVINFSNNYTTSLQRLMHLLNKHTKNVPENITADGKRQVVFKANQKAAVPYAPFESRGAVYNLKQFIKLYTNLEKRVNRRIDETNEEISKRIIFIVGGGVTTKAPANVDVIRRRFINYSQGAPGPFTGLNGEEVIVSMDEAYTVAEKSFTVELDEA